MCRAECVEWCVEWRVWSGVCGVGGVVCVGVCGVCVWSGVCGVAYVVWWSGCVECVVCMVRVECVRCGVSSTSV